MILFQNTFEQKVNNISSDGSGNLIILDVSISETRQTIPCVYGPNDDNPIFYKDLFEKKNEIGSEYVMEFSF